MKKILLFLTILISSAFAMNAQLYYFVKSGSDVSSNTKISMFYIEGSRCITFAQSASKVSAELNRDSRYWENTLSRMLNKQREPFEYDSSLSTSSYDVYKSPIRSRGNVMTWENDGSITSYAFRALSSDGRTLITWRQKKGSNEVVDKTYYERIDSDILNQDPHDFLR